MSIPRSGSSWVKGTVAVAAVLLVSAPALAQEDNTIQGSVSGTLALGDRATFEVSATHPDGWRNLDELNITLELKDVALDELTFDVDDGAISAGGSSALIGTGDTTSGQFFRVSALDVTQATGGNEVTVTFDAEVIEEVPQRTRFRFVALADDGETVTVTRAASVPEDEEGGLPIGTVALAIAAALVAGGYLGSRATAHRRPAGRSMYGQIQRRLEEQRREPGRRP